MPQTRTTPKFQTYWPTISTTAHTDYPQEPWRDLRPDESVCHLRIDLQNATRADVAREVGCSRAAVGQAKKRADVKLETYRLGRGSRTSHEPTPIHDTIETRHLVAHRAGRNYVKGPKVLGTAQLMSEGYAHDEGFGFVGFGTVADEKWGETSSGMPSGERFKGYRKEVRESIKQAKAEVAARLLCAHGKPRRGTLTRDMQECGLHSTGDRGDGGLGEPGDQLANEWVKQYGGWKG